MLDLPAVPRPAVTASWRGWAGVRLLLLVPTPVVLLAALLWGEHAATLGDLQEDVESGRVSRVQVTGDLSAGATGTARQDVRWRSGGRVHEAAVQLVAGPLEPGTVMTSEDGSPLPVVHRDVGALVGDWGPAVRVDRADHDSSVSTTVLGVRVSGWVGPLVLVQWFGAVFLLVRGPEPQWVSRWGWFWFLALPFGTTAFLLSSGPWPGRRRVAPGPRRLRGGRAFLVSLVLAGASGGAGAL